MLELGLDVHKFMFHSFRRGGCQYGFQRGEQVQDLKIWGGWASDAIKAYVLVDHASAKAALAIGS